MMVLAGAAAMESPVGVATVATAMGMAAMAMGKAMAMAGLIGTFLMLY